MLKDVFTFRDKCVIALHDVVSCFADQPSLPFGVSFLVVVKEKNALVDLALESIAPYASEVVLVIAKEGEKPCWANFVRDLNDGLSRCRFRWVFKWDGDMVALEGFGAWLRRLRDLNESFFYEIDVARINTDKKTKFGGFEGRLFTQHPSVKYKWVPDRDSLVFPLWYRLRRWEDRYILHLDPK